MKDQQNFRWDYDWRVVAQDSTEGHIAVQFWNYWYGGPSDYPKDAYGGRYLDDSCHDRNPLLVECV